MSIPSAILSIHDVAPATIDPVAAIIDKLPKHVEEKLILLVIPGLEWRSKDLDVLRSWQDRGYILAGHGWQHTAAEIKTFYHKLHALFISRNVAEHLSLNSSEIIELMNKNHDWFATHQLASPDCYVPPAWALGRISRNQLRKTPFEVIETTQGYIRTSDSKSRALPLVGYEADTQLRKFSLLTWNKLNETLCSTAKPLRISIHPFDAGYLLADSMYRCLNQVGVFQTYRDLYTNLPASAA